MKRILWTLVIAAALAAAAAAGFVAGGLYDVSATGPHLQPVYTLLETTMHRSVARRARGIVPPDLSDSSRLDRGALCYRSHCASCHGGPGQAVAPYARSMQPLPGPLVDAPARWTSGELYWIVRHGIKMSGMPAWQERLPDADLWAVVAFVETLPGLSAPAYRQRLERLGPQDCEPDAQAAPPDGPPDPQRGRTLFHQYACNACHEIPSVTGPKVQVGPPLAAFGRRGLIAGRVPNTPENLVRWLRDPASVDAQTAMPDLDVGARDARDMAAYLGRLR